MPTIAETERLVLRTWKHGDRAKFDRHCNTPAVMQWLGGSQGQNALSEDVQWFKQCQDEYGHTLWVVERKEDGEFLGFCGLDKLIYETPPHLANEVEIGWRLREDAWGKKYATEAARVSLDIAFRIRSMDRVVSRVAEKNGASRRIMEKLGMERAPELDYREGEIVYTISRDDWLNRDTGNHSPQATK